MTGRLSAFVFVLLSVSACTTLPTPKAPVAGIDGEACVGRVPEAMAGLTPVDNPALLAKAQGRSEKGGTCTARVFSVQAPLVLYRVFDSSNSYSRQGGWWSLTVPAGPRDAYRTANAICPEWSKLDRLVKCEVRPGTEIVIGTTQSATCEDGTTYSRNAVLQVYVPNDGRAGIVHVGACAEPSDWP